MEEIQKRIDYIINYVIQKELKTGKLLEDAKRKYTHGYCMSLATLIKAQFLDNENVRMFEFGRTYRKIETSCQYKWKGQVWHICIVVGDVDELGRPVSDAIVFDINGAKLFKDMPEYLTEQYPNPFDCNYTEDNVFALDHKKYVIEDSVEPAEMKKYEILREEEGVIEECYYEFLDEIRRDETHKPTPFFALLSEQSQVQECGEIEWEF